MATTKPLQVGLAIVERTVAGHVRSLLLSGKWQDISARGARNLRHACARRHPTHVALAQLPLVTRVQARYRGGRSPIDQEVVFKKDCGCQWQWKVSRRLRRLLELRVGTIETHNEMSAGGPYILKPYICRHRGPTRVSNTSGRCHPGGISQRQKTHTSKGTCSSPIRCGRGAPWCARGR